MRITRRSASFASLFLITLGYSVETKAVEFGAPTSYPVGTNPTGVVVADFNGDGKPDVAVANHDTSNISILLGNGDGTFQPAVNFNVGLSPSSIAVGDFNGDGKMDLVLFQPGDPTNSVAGEASVLLGNGDGSFQTAEITSLGVSAVAMAVGDFNGDKKTDLILSDSGAASGASSLEILIGKGDGTLQSEQAIPADLQNLDEFAVADFNKDGKLDLAFINSTGVQLLLGKGDGTFQAGWSAAAGQGFSAFAIFVADLNGDGDPDLIVGAQSQPPPCVKPNPFAICPPPTVQMRFSFYPGLGNGTFGSEVALSGGALGTGMVTGDFNGDEKTDLVNSAFVISLGRGDGTFVPSISISSTASGIIAGAPDLNGDKLDDLIAFDPASNAVLVFLNETPRSGADLAIVASGAGVGHGANLIYTADVLNEGPENATNVTFTDTLPTGVTFVSATSSVGTCSAAGSVVTCSVGSLSELADASIAVNVAVVTTGSLTNAMTVSATESDLAPANNSASQSVSVFDVSITKVGSGSGTVTGTSVVRFLISSFSCGDTCSQLLLSGRHLFFRATADPGSIFQAWGGDCAGTANTANCTLTMDSDKTVSASFVLEPKLNVTVAGAGTGTVTTGDGSISCASGSVSCSSAYPPGTAVTLSALPSTGSTFTEWSGACSGANPGGCTVTLNSDQSVTATFNLFPDFIFHPAASSLTLQPGAQVADVLSISEQGGFSSAIQLTCAVTGPAPLPTCSLSPSSIPAGANSPTTTLTVHAGGLSAGMPPVSNHPAGLVAANFLPCVLLWFAWAAGIGPKRWALSPCFVALLAAMLFAAACGSAGSGGTSGLAPQNYAVSVTGATGALEHTITVYVTVP